MAGSNRPAPARSRRSAPRGTRTTSGRAAPSKRRIFDYPRTGYTGLHRWLPSWRVVAGTALAGTFLVAGAVVAAYATIDIPEPGEDVSAETTTVYYADNPDGTPGEVMGTYAVQKREIVEFGTLPEYVGNAVVAAEDKTFWENRGVSLTSTARAFLNNVSGGETQGGSTLTQQYVERYYVSETTTDYVGKAKEALLAIKVTNEQTKPEILGGYLNTIYFGRDAYGIEAAAESYFGVGAKDLTLSQAALIAGIIPAPNAWDPAVSPEKAEARWNIVLDSMVDSGFITAAERAEQEFPATVEYVRSEKYRGPQGYLLKMVEDEVARDPLGLDREELDRGGYTIHTTIQKPVQAQAEAAAAKLVAGELTNGEAPDSHTKVAIATTDPDDGSIVALYGGPDFLTDQINRAEYDAIQAGSTFKPFTLVAALEQGISLDETYSGRSPMEVEGWKDPVNNFGDQSFGTIDLATATANSVNTVYAQLNNEVGFDATADVAQRAGITTVVDRNPSNVLGVSSVHPLDMANAYGTFAAQGYHSDAHIVASVDNRDGTVAYEADPERTQVFEDDVMAEATYAMTQVVERGSGEDYIKPLDRPIAGKTGTSTGNISAWFVGYTPTLSTAVALSQVGEDGSSQVTITPVGETAGGNDLRQVTGGSIPAHLWAEYMGPVLEMPEYSDRIDFPERPKSERKPSPSATPSQTPTETPTPTQTPSTPANVYVPAHLQGKMQADAVAALIAVGLEPVVKTEPSEDVVAGRVVRVEPGSGVKVPYGSSVTIIVSSGPKQKPTPKPTEPPATETPAPEPTPTETAAPARRP